MQRTAVLTTDLQYDLVNKDPERHDIVQAALPELSFFLSALRSLGVAVIHLQLINLLSDPRAERYNGWLPATADSPGKAVLADLLDDSDELVEKHQASGFFGTRLHELLQERGVEDLIIVGMHTQICVQTTAADAYFRGYNVAVPREGVISTRPEEAKRALDWISEYCGAVLSMNEVLNHVRAGTLHLCMPTPSS
jgi:nicotinamidase-related amidase